MRKFKHWRNLLLTDRAFCERQFAAAYGRPLDLANPVTFDEKLQWYKLYYRRSLMTCLTDKYEVRQHLIRKELGHILNELYGVYDRFENIRFDALPDAFVLKANHGSSWNIICKDKALLDLTDARRRM